MSNTSDVQNGVRTPLPIFALSVRWLIVMRIFCSCLVLLDLLSRFSDWHIFYSADGLLHDWYLSTNTSPYFALRGIWLHSDWAVALIGLSTALGAILLGVGVAVPWTTFVTWFGLSIVQRLNPFVDNNGDIALRLALFWGLFLPWAGRLQKIFKKSAMAVGCSTFALRVQLFWILFASGAMKTGDSWVSGRAICEVFQSSYARFPFFHELVHRLGLCRPLSWAVPVLECLVAILIIIPVRSIRFRKAVLVFLIFSFLSVAVTMNLGLVPWVMLPYCFALWPERFSLPASKAARIGRGADPLILFAMVTICAINVAVVFPRSNFLPPTWFRVAQILGLEQSWMFFSPNPPRQAVQLRIQSEHYQWDLPGRRDSPAMDSLNLSQIRWRILRDHLSFGLDRELAPSILQYFCRSLAKKAHSSGSWRLELTLPNIPFSGATILAQEPCR